MAARESLLIADQIAPECISELLTTLAFNPGISRNVK